MSNTQAIKHFKHKDVDYKLEMTSKTWLAFSSFVKEQRESAVSRVTQHMAGIAKKDREVLLRKALEIDMQSGPVTEEEALEVLMTEKGSRKMFTLMFSTHHPAMIPNEIDAIAEEIGPNGIAEVMGLA